MKISQLLSVTALSTSLLLNTLLAAESGQSESKVIRSGQPAPSITLGQLWNAPDGTDLSWSALRGQVVVLDFWATWCGPCVQGIPDMNKLARDCQNLPVRFLAITDEKPEVARAFLKKNPLETWVGIDTDGSLVKAYGVESRPFVVVVDQQGKVAAVTRPYALSRPFIEAVIAGKTDSLYEPLIRVDIRRHLGVSSVRSGSFSDTGVKLRNTSFEQILNLISPASDWRTDIRASVPVGDYDIEINAPGADTNAWRTVLRSSVENLLGLRLREEDREQDVLLLQIVPGRQPRLSPPEARDSVTGSPTGFIATSTTMKNFADNLGARLGQPVLDETGLTNRFKVELQWDRSNRDTMLRAVSGQLGMELKPAKRKLTHLVVESVNGATSR